MLAPVRRILAMRDCIGGDPGTASGNDVLCIEFRDPSGGDTGDFVHLIELAGLVGRLWYNADIPARASQPAADYPRSSFTHGLLRVRDSIAAFYDTGRLVAPESGLALSADARILSAAGVATSWPMGNFAAFGAPPADSEGRIIAGGFQIPQPDHPHRLPAWFPVPL